MGNGDLVVDVVKVRKAAQNAIPLSVTTYTMPHEIEVYLEAILEVFLTELGQSKLKDYLTYCLRELAVNAKKANTKRVYFREKNLEITDIDDYEAGMKDFKQETLDNIHHYLTLQREQGLYIKILLQSKGTLIVIEVRNNVELTQKEYIRIHDKLARSRSYSSLEEALAQVLDTQEGAGLGLVILVLMLKKINLTEDCFDIWAENGETIARVTIPVSSTHIENLSLLSDEIVRQISRLPQFPESIVTIQRMISDPKVEIVEIARQISTDPSMTADLLRLVNSAAFMLSKKVDSIAEAVKFVGLRGIRNLLYSYGTQKILGDESQEDKKKLWEHSYRAAFYSYNLALNFKRQNKALLDDAYVGGMLHDMGKIIFSSVHPALLDRIQKFCATKDIPTRTFEDLSAGMNHAEIGAKIAEKWNFPETLIAAIRYHHEPALVPPEYKDVVYTVYLANTICDYESREVLFDQIDKKVLENYGISSEQQFLKITGQFCEAFKRESARSLSDSKKIAR